MTKLYRVLGKRGRITIPYDRTVVVKREKICDNCCAEPTKTVKTKQDGITLMQFLDSLSSDEQRAALIHLSVRWAEQQGGVRDA